MLCPEGRFERQSKQVGNAQRPSFTWSGVLPARQQHVYLLRCFSHTASMGDKVRTDLAHPQITHEVFCLYQVREKSAPISLLFRHQYDFGSQLLNISDPHVYKENLHKLQHVASCVTDAVGHTLLYRDTLYNRRRSLSELVGDETKPAEMELVRKSLRDEHLQTDLFWALVIEQAYLSCVNPSGPVHGVKL